MCSSTDSSYDDVYLLCAAVRGEVGRFMDESASFGVGTGGRSLPVDTAEVDVAELVWVDVRIGISLSARAVKSISSKLAIADVAIMGLD